MITHQQCKLIHLARRKVGMTEPDYRAMLRRVAGVDSSAQLDNAGFDAVMEEMGRLGFKTIQKAPQYGERQGWATEAQLNLLRSLYRKYSGSEDESRLEHWLDKHFHVTSLRFLDSATVPKVIGALQYMVEWRKSHPRYTPQGDTPSHP